MNLITDEYRARKRRERWSKIEIYRANQRAWRAQNREKLRLSSAIWRKNNPDYWKNRRLNEPDYRLKTYLRTRVYNAIKRLLKSGSKSAPTAELIGCSMPLLKAHIESKFRPGMTWENYGPVWHMDHIKPCALFDLTKPKQQSECFSWKNLQPLFAQENRIKNRKYLCA